MLTALTHAQHRVSTRPQLDPVERRREPEFEKATAEREGTANRLPEPDRVGRKLSPAAVVFVERRSANRRPSACRADWTPPIRARLVHERPHRACSRSPREADQSWRGRGTMWSDARRPV